MARHLLLVNLGPIQDFIASARRCQDLWFGSKLLSELAAAAARGIAHTIGDDGSLILPGKLYDPRDDVSVANKILALVPEGQVPAKVAEAGKASMATRREELAKTLFDTIKGPKWDRHLAEEQVADLMEYVWVAAPLKDDDYKASRQRVEGLLSARKRTRSWGPVPWEPITGRPKSSLDGQRESVLHESLFEDVRTGKLSPAALRRAYSVKKAERLCGVGLLKRVGQVEGENGERPAFHSTSHVATGPLLVRIARLERGSDAIEQYADALGALGIELDPFSLRIAETQSMEDPIPTEGRASAPVTVARAFGERRLDGYILYEDRLRELFERYSSVPLSDRAAKERDARAALAQCLDALDHAAPPPAYYAFLLADRDHMGDALDALDDHEQHQRFSIELEEFARGCRRIVADHGGSLVYAGGDDVLALLPLHTALGCAAKLRGSFGTIRSPREGKKLTLSVGLGIAHHMDAMDEARALAKDAEQSAKKGGRDALGIMVSKRSGATVAMCTRWDDDPVGRLHGWCKLLRDEDLPDGVAFALEAEVALFEAPGPREKPDETPDEKARARAEFNEVVHALARRIIGRKRRDRGEAPISEENVAALLRGSFDGSKDPIVAVKRLSNEIQIARLFLAAHESAWGKKTSP